MKLNFGSIFLACLSFFLVFIGIEAFTAESAGTIYFVDQSATNGSQDGASWENGFLHLQDALDVAQAGDQIYVAAGVYKPTLRSEAGVPKTETFTLIEGVEIYGGFPTGGSNFVDRDWDLHQTILSGDLDDNDTNTNGIVMSFSDTAGDNAFNVVTGNPAISYTLATVLDGFVVTAGQTENTTTGDNSEGAGIRFESNASPTLRNLWIVGNHNTRNDGGGIHFLNDNSPLLENIVVQNNHAGDHGGGIFFENRNSPILKNVSLVGNTADKTASLYLHEGNDAKLANTHFCGNSNANAGNAKIGAGLSIESDNTILLMNGTFAANNNPGAGGAFRLTANNQVSFHNVSMAGNHASSGGAIYFVGPDNSLDLYNSVLWGNSSEINNIGLNTLDVRNSIVGQTETPFSGTGNAASVDQPFIAMPEGAENCGNLGLIQSSNAVDAGANDLIPVDALDIDSDGDVIEKLPQDIQGRDRIFNSVVDMGAVEISVLPTVQTISFELPESVDDGMEKGEQFMLNASASSGLDVVYSTTTQLVCTISNDVVTMNAGGVCSIVADQLGDGTYSAADSVTRDILVRDLAKIDQTITFSSPADETQSTIGEILPLQATSTSNLDVEFSSRTPLVCNISSNNVKMLSMGECEIEAIQIGDEIYNPASKVRKTISVNKIFQEIDLAALPSSADVDSVIDLSASATSGLDVVLGTDSPEVCSVSGNKATMLIGGDCLIRASQTGNDIYQAAADIVQLIVVTKLDQTISFVSPENNSEATVGELVNLEATSNSGLTVQFTTTTTDVCSISGNSATMLSLGDCEIVATQEGDDRYDEAVPIIALVGVTSSGNLDQMITFASPEENQEFDVGATFLLTATASSGLVVAFKTLTLDTCLLAGHTVIAVGNGKCQIQASQPGNEEFGKAIDVVRTVFIKKEQIITFPTLPASITAKVGDHVELTATANSGLPVFYRSLTPSICIVDGKLVEIQGVGSCQVGAYQEGNDGWYAAPSITISIDVGYQLFLPIAPR